MAQIKVNYDKIGKTFPVWFGDSREEVICEETGEEVILMRGNMWLARST
jgi:hypothetical protein